MERVHGSDGRQEIRQVLRDLLEFHVRGGVTGDNLLLLLSLVNILGVIEILGRRQGGNGGQFFQQLLGPLIFTAVEPQKQESAEANAAGNRAISRGKELAGLLGGRESLKLLTGLLANREVMEKVVPLLQQLTGSVGAKNRSEGQQEAGGSKKPQKPEVIHWDFGRSDGKK